MLTKCGNQNYLNITPCPSFSPLPCLSLLLGPCFSFPRSYYIHPEYSSLLLSMDVHCQLFLVQPPYLLQYLSHEHFSAEWLYSSYSYFSASWLRRRFVSCRLRCYFSCPCYAGCVAVAVGVASLNMLCALLYWAVAVFTRVEERRLKRGQAQPSPPTPPLQPYTKPEKIK